MRTTRRAFRKFFGFLLVGGAGFIVDAGILTVLSSVVWLDIYLSRLISFIFATFTTWLLNRLFVFRKNLNNKLSKKAEYTRYIGVQTLGGATNLLVFAIVIHLEPALIKQPVIPLAWGSAFGLIVNYLGARYWVFNVS